MNIIQELDNAEQQDFDDSFSIIKERLRNMSEKELEELITNLNKSS